MVSEADEPASSAWAISGMEGKRKSAPKKARALRQIIPRCGVEALIVTLLESAETPRLALNKCPPPENVFECAFGVTPLLAFGLSFC